MDEIPWYEEDRLWIIWNSALGIRDFVTIDRVEVDAKGRHGWLEEPYDMVGPFDMDTLVEDGKISFAECTVMSRERWRDDQQRLREESFIRQQKAQAKMFEELARKNRRRRAQAGEVHGPDERECRELLALPLEGRLESSQIKAAFRQRAKKAHPDVGGSHEHFVRIMEARDALLERTV